MELRIERLWHHPNPSEPIPQHVINRCAKEAAAAVAAMGIYRNVSGTVDYGADGWYKWTEMIEGNAADGTAMVKVCRCCNS